ncbi:sugar transferase [Soehngenia saccharolytica]|nr:sugar transferase [Soehngenia saccharolytica]
MQTETKKDAIISNCPTDQLIISNSIYKKFFKRPLDFLLSLIALIILSPILLITAILVRIKLGSPIIFKQQRPGLNEKIFTIYKFRTMTDAKDENGNLLPDSERLTSFGRFLRSTSIDELPELVNILKGDMSIVGPRPLAVEYLPFYTNEERMRHKVRPGLTGLAQTNGRNTIIWEERFKLDTQYVNTLSFSLDLSIILKTFSIIFKREGIGERGIDAPIDFNIYRKEKYK